VEEVVQEAREWVEWLFITQELELTIKLHRSKNNEPVTQTHQ
jgi:hypothetical protein